MSRSRLVALAVGGAALVAVLLRRRSDEHRAGPPDRPLIEAPASPPAGKPPTRAELYERARELNIAGRSAMSKAELERAVAEHERAAG